MRSTTFISIFLILLIFVVPSVAFAEDSDSSESAWEWSTPTGKITQGLGVFKQRLEGLPSYQERLDAEVEAGFGNTTYGFRVIPWVQASRPRAFFEIKEGWVERVSSSVDVRVGNQIFAWGAADQVNPTDLWNPKDLYDPFQSAKLPIGAIRARVHPPEMDSFSLELIVTPFFRASRLPLVIPDTGVVDISLDDSRTLLPLPSRLVSSGLSAPLYYKVSEATYPGTFQFGARLMAMRLGGWDFSFSGLSGVETLPRFAVTKQGSMADPTLPITLTLYPSYHRQNMLGLDGSGSVSIAEMDFGTRFEIAYVNRDNSRAFEAPAEFQADLLRDDYLHAVIGTDYTFQRNILGTVLYFNLQYVRFQKLGTKEQPTGALVVEGLPNAQPWDDNFVLYWENRVGSQFKFANSVVTSLRNNDAYVTPAFHYGWSDNLKTILGGELFFGSSAGFFGQFKDNSRVTLTANYTF